MNEVQVAVTVKFLGLARDLIGLDQKLMTISACPDQVVATVTAMIHGQTTDTDRFAMGIFINGRQIDYLMRNNLQLHDGDVIAVIPVISGG
jgi:molybdopterin converting factor small subunit